MKTTLSTLISHISTDILRPLAGCAGTDREVKSIGVVENAAAGHRFSDGELVLTGGFLPQQPSSFYISLFDKLNASGCAGLCMKNTPPEGFDKEVLRYADNLKFPIYEIQSSFSGTELSKMMYRRINCVEPVDVEYILSVVRELSKLTVLGCPLDEIIGMMARKLSNTVIFLTPHLVVSSIQTVLSGRCKNIFYPSKGQHLFTPVEQSRLEKGFAELPTVAYQDRILRDDESMQFILFPAQCGDSLMGYLCILSTNKPFSLLEFWVSESFLPILAQSMRTKSQTEALTMNIDDLFMWQVLLQQNPDTQRAKQYCALCNFDYNATRICIVMEYPTLLAVPTIQRRSMMEKQRAYMNRRLENHDGSYKLILIHDNFLTILRTVPRNTPRIAVIQEHEFWGAQIVQDIISQFGLDCFIGLSETCAGLDTLSECYVQAAESIALGKKIRPARSCFSYHEQYLFHRLWHNFTTDELHKICVNILEPIMDDTPDLAELRRTLETYISCTGNLSQTAERLHIHRNTLNYRMTKLKNLLAVEEISADDFTRYMVGLTILKII